MSKNEPLKRNRRPTHPGVILKEHYLVPRKVKQKDLAEAIGTTEKYVSQLVHGVARIDRVIAARLAAVLVTSPALWLNLQATVDAWDAERDASAWSSGIVYGPRLAANG